MERLLATPDNTAATSTEDILRYIFRPGMAFDNIPQSALRKARKENLQAISAFNTATPVDGAADFSDDDFAVGTEQIIAYLKLYIFIHAVLRRLYHGKEGAG